MDISTSFVEEHHNEANRLFPIHNSAVLDAFIDLLAISFSS